VVSPDDRIGEPFAPPGLHVFSRVPGIAFRSPGLRPGHSDCLPTRPAASGRARPVCPDCATTAPAAARADGLLRAAVRGAVVPAYCVSRAARSGPDPESGIRGATKCNIFLHNV